VRTNQSRLNVVLLVLLVLALAPDLARYIREKRTSPPDYVLVNITTAALTKDQDGLNAMCDVAGDDGPPYVSWRGEEEATVVVPLRGRLCAVTPAMVTLILQHGKWRAFECISQQGHQLL
jgi:hypothetical protein